MTMIPVEESTLVKRFHEQQGESEESLHASDVHRRDSERRFDMLLVLFAIAATLASSVFLMGRFGTVLDTDALAISISVYGAVFATVVTLIAWARSHYRHTDSRPFAAMGLWLVINVVYVSTVLDWSLAGGV